MKLKLLSLTVVLTLLISSAACAKQGSVSYKESVKTALEQADLKDVSVSEDTDKNTITLGGTLHSEDAKQRAMDVAKANAGTRIVANEVSVQPVGLESEAKKEASNLDDGIESNYKAALIEKGLDKQDISFSVKNGVLKLKGKVKTSVQRSEAEKLAQSIPHVQQVINELAIKG